MVNLMKANRELFRRAPDECFESFADLQRHCFEWKEESAEHWFKPQTLIPLSKPGSMTIRFESGDEHQLNDWSFSQLCRLCGVSRDTLNRLSPETAAKAIAETLPNADRPIQFHSNETVMRSIHGVSYTRLWNSELLDVVSDYESEFQPPHRAFNGHGTGLYCGEQDLFAFLVDNDGWVTIGDQKFAPGFFVWNSEVGRRSLGIQTFWYQHICGNHIVWDAIEVVDYSRKHTSSVREGLSEIRCLIEALIERRDERKDKFEKGVELALSTKIGVDLDEAFKVITAQGIPRNLAKDASKVVNGNHSIFAWVDALTRASGSIKFAGNRNALDQKIGSLMSLAI